MNSKDLTHDELVEFASLLFGSQWRNALAEHLRINRKQLVLTLAAGDPIPESITLPVVSLMENHLTEQETAQRKIRARLAEVSQNAPKAIQPRGARKAAS